MLDSLWYAPLVAPADGGVDQATPLQSAYGQGNEVQAAQPFTVSLVSACISADHLRRRGWLPELFKRTHDILIYTTTTRGARPPVQRVHLHRPDVDLNVEHFEHDMLSDTVHLCDDYNGTEDLYVELHVATPSTLRLKTDANLRDLAEVAGSAAGFPALAPYIADVKFGLDLVQAVEHLLTAHSDDRAERIEDTLRLAPPSTTSAKTLRYGRYVAFSDDVDGSACKLLVNGRVEGPDIKSVSYGVFRIDDADAPTPDFIQSQRVATLLTGLNQKGSGQVGGSGSDPAITFLKDTVQGYANFEDLKRYHQLKQKQDPTSAEQSLMKKMEENDDLKPFLA